MRISDWSSDVCSSDLIERQAAGEVAEQAMIGVEPEMIDREGHLRMRAVDAVCASFDEVLIRRDGYLGRRGRCETRRDDAERTEEMPHVSYTSFVQRPRCRMTVAAGEADIPMRTPACGEGSFGVSSTRYGTKSALRPRVSH